MDYSGLGYLLRARHLLLPSVIHLFDHSIAIYVYIIVSELLVQPIWEITLEIEWLYTILLDLILRDYTHFQSYFSQHLSVVHFNEVIS